ncbi:MAG TPA: alpha-amylase, partial [Actinoplanes sp.]
KAEHPGLVLIAEVYWDTEWTLQHQGFDFCYDKRLYDRLAHETAAAVRVHLTGDQEFQRRLVRFTENHDEPRAATAMPGGRDRAAAAAAATLPGATLWHDGQFVGRRVQLPVFLNRAPDEPVDEDKLAFYRRLTEVAGGLRRGEWRLLDALGRPDNDTGESVLAWAWHDGRPHHIVVVNLSAEPAQARIPLPWDELRGRGWRLVDLLDGRAFERGGEDLGDPGLYVDLPAWGVHLLAVAAMRRS